MASPKLTNEIVTAAILGFEEQRRRIDVQIADLRAMLSKCTLGQLNDRDHRVG